MLNWNGLLKDLGKYLLKNIAVYPKLELMFVMVIVPLIMNSIQVNHNFLLFLFQFWVIDNILKESDESRIERLSRGKEKLSQVGYQDFFEKLNEEKEEKSETNGDSKYRSPKI